MPSPFPGMDPYLEDRELWSGFHHYLPDEIVKQLNPLLVPKYYADVEIQVVLQEVGVSTIERVRLDIAVLDMAPKSSSIAYSPTAIGEAPMQRLVEIPGETKLRAVEVRVAGTKELVTTIEILSPENKLGDGLQKYRKKRERILRSDVHLIEIDFLRRGQRPGVELAEPPIDADYVVLVNSATGGTDRISQIWPIGINESLPTIPVPLLPEDDDIPLNLAWVFAKIYEEHFYSVRIDYDLPIPAPKLRPLIQKWWAQRNK